MPANLYVHFPFCRRKCSYCALHSRAGASSAEREAYVARLVTAIGSCQSQAAADAGFSTVYFGGGSPALCDLLPVLDALAPRLAKDCEITVELHPLDVTVPLLNTLHAGGVNRISMGVQSLDDAILADMGRGYSFAEAERAFALVRERFDNAGIDLIVGYPGETVALSPRHGRLAKWGLRHCSVYSLILEERSILAHRLRSAAEHPRLPSDDEALNRIAVVSRFLGALGLHRYEISSYAVPGYECRHNLAVWRGEDYLGLGEGAAGRVGLVRTSWENGQARSVRVDAAVDRKERALFRLRTCDGLDIAAFPEWAEPLDAFCAQGLLSRSSTVYRLTERGTEVCDTILAELV